jgi:hypothetical protein
MRSAACVGAVARKIRVEFAGACYHVINRGNYRRDLFASQGAAQAFERCLFASSMPGGDHRFAGKWRAA